MKFFTSHELWKSDIDPSLAYQLRNSFIPSSSSFKYNFFKDKRGIRKRNLDDVVFKAQGEMHVWETICSVERTVAEGILFK